MLGLIFGILFILGGIGMGLLSAMAAGMASRGTTRWENTWSPLLWFAIPTAIGILLIVFRNW